MKIDTIISDLGGVLINVDTENVCAKFAQHSLLSVEAIKQRFSPSVVTSFELDLAKGLMTPQRFYELASKELRLKSLSFQEFDRIYSDRFTRKDDSINFIRNLSRKYTIAMLSNTCAPHYAYWVKALGEDMKLFKEVVLSFQIGIAKPDRRIFLEVVKRLGVKPEQCVFIDDVEEYVEAASRVGMHGIQFISVDQLKSDLGKLGVRV